jgi:PAS domain S-box-containing protein
VAQQILTQSKQPTLVLDEHLRILFANQSFCSWMQVPWSELEHKAIEQFLRSPQIITLLLSTGLETSAHELPVECDLPRSGQQRLHLRVNVFRAAKQQLRSVVIDWPSTGEQETDGPDIDGRHINRPGKDRPSADATNAIGLSAKRVDTLEPTQDQTIKPSDAVWAQYEANLLRSVMESSGDGIGVLNSTGHCVLWNPACERILGLKPGSLHCDQWPQHFGLYLADKKTFFPAEQLPLARALRGESTDHVDIFVRNHSRKEGLWVSMTARPLTKGQYGAVATLRDISFRKVTEETLTRKSEEVERSNRELEQFAYVASHDLQEPLRMVSSYVQLLSRRYRGKLDAEADEFITYAVEGAKRMSDLINDLLGYSRIGRGEVVKGPVDCDAVLEKVLRNLRSRILASGAVITHDPLPTIEANETQFVQLLQNLVDNAIKFRSAATPSIHLSAKMEEGKWIFSVADNGIGIAPEYSSRVFVIFQRLHNREAYPGTGIGLAVCKKIVEQQGGTIWLEPQAGGGTRVVFTWPVLNPMPEKGSECA